MWTYLTRCVIILTLTGEAGLRAGTAEEESNNWEADSWEPTVAQSVNRRQRRQDCRAAGRGGQVETESGHTGRHLSVSVWGDNHSEGATAEDSGSVSTPSATARADVGGKTRDWQLGSFAWQSKHFFFIKYGSTLKLLLVFFKQLGSLPLSDHIIHLKDLMSSLTFISI